MNRNPPTVRRASLARPDDARSFPHGSGSIVRVGPVTLGRAVLEPGWRWSTDVRPAVGGASCQVHHLHVVLAGRFGVQMDDGSHHEFGPEDVVDVPPGHDAWVVGNETTVLLDISGNSDNFALPIAASRVVLTLLMSDIVDSTRRASEIGDAAWAELLLRHDRAVRRALDRFRGHEVKTTGDGFLATFDSAAAAVRCGLEIAQATSEIGVAVRVGVHTGEVETLADDVRGIAVHATARIMAAAQPSEVLASAVTRTLADGSGVRFEPRGAHRLKGLAAELELHAAMPGRHE
jgi:class 3 adenylate cyclase